MKKTIIKFRKEIFDDLRNYLLEDEYEKHAFLLCHTANNDNKHIYYPKEIIIFDENKISNSQTHFKADKEYLHQIFLKFVNSEYDGLISCHSHPFENGNVWFSSIDDRNDTNLMSYFYDEIIRKKENSNLFAMVFGQNTIGARGFNKLNSDFYAVEKIVIMNEPIEYIIPANLKKNTFSFEKNIFNRQILAFGEDGQKRLSTLQVSLIGAGGTGSILAEGLLRLGIQNLNIIDDDKLELTNLNRWQGGKRDDVGKYKVDILHSNLQEMFESSNIIVFKSSIFDKSVIDEIKMSDVIIGAVDNHKTRYLLNKLSLQYLIPFLDCSNGIIVDDENNKIDKIGIRNTVVIPSVTSCLDCVDGRYYDKSKFRFDFVSAQTRNSLKQYSYIKSDTDSIPSPSVYPINMMSVSILLLEFMNLFMGFKPTYWNTYIDYLNFSKKDLLSRDTLHQKEEPYDSCFHCNDFIALGDSEDILKFKGEYYGYQKN